MDNLAIFDVTMFEKTRFDVTLEPLGWFSADLIRPTGTTATTTAGLFSVPPFPEPFGGLFE
jgi:hypothetical protein